jgi:multimeric flavodoxin WrbA
MKVLLINGSPNAKGCTFTALGAVAGALNENGVETEIIQVGHKDIRGCIGCRQCSKAGKCVFDDGVNEAAALFAEADGLVIGSPVYFASPNGGVLSFADRLFFSTFGVDKRMKVGAAVVSARRGGCTATVDALNPYFTISGMPVASGSYWNMVHGHTPEDVMKDAEGLRNMRVLGQNMAFLIKSIALGKAEYGLPAVEPPVFTNFIR